SALYRDGQYSKAIEALTDENSAKAHYNRGNSYTKLGQLPEALKAYNAALALNPNHTDAHYNKKLIEDALKKQQPPDQDASKNTPPDEDSAHNNNDESSETDESPKDKQDNPSQSEQNSTTKENQTPEDNPTKPNDESINEPEENPSEDHLNRTPETDDGSNKVNEQWLKRIPDDPSGLLQRKFKYQYSQQRNDFETNENW
ncbi:MAG: tetratricopeptide repeat protein, partial [Methylococcales bacterium]